MRRTRLLAVLAVLVACLGRASARELGGYYVGFGAGTSDWNAGLDTFDDGTLMGGTADGEDQGWKLLVGYRFSRVFGIEGGYADLGRVTFQGVSSGCPAPGDCFPAGPVSIVRQADGFFGEAVGSWPFGSFDVYGKIGFFGVDLDSNPQDRASARGLTSTETVWGAGVQYRFARPIVRLEWERVTEVPDDSLDFVTASLLFRFRR